MGEQVQVTRTETRQHAWECVRCRAHGLVTLRAVGESGWKRVGYFNPQKAEARAYNDAAVAVQRDAERIMEMIRCPKCLQRAPRVRFWSGVRLVPAVIAGLVVGGLMGGGVASILGVSFWLGLPAAPIGGYVGTLTERRRWREARSALIVQLEGGEAPKLPEAPKPKLEPLRTNAPEQVEQASDRPRFLQ